MNISAQVWSEFLFQPRKRKLMCLVTEASDAYLCKRADRRIHDPIYYNLIQSTIFTAQANQSINQFYSLNHKRQEEVVDLYLGWYSKTHLWFLTMAIPGPV